MRKIKVDLQCSVPSWHFCNLDGFTADGRYSKETCRFCVSTKQGHRCLLYDESLTTDSHFVHKTAECIEAAASGTATAHDAPVVSPKLIAKEAIKDYIKLVNDLTKQGYPRGLAEKIALQDVTGG